jgi:pimeloyl-ACP methyl ester carboxylesterase
VGECNPPPAQCRPPLSRLEENDVNATVDASVRAERAYPNNLLYFKEVDRGGHFAAWEQPALFSAELRAAFRTLRGR